MDEPQFSFQNARSKIKWADQQVNDLETLCNRFIKQNTNLALAKTQMEPGIQGYSFLTTDIPVDIAMLAGDAVRNFRGALDYCWCGLERKRTGILKSGVTMPHGTDRKNITTSVQKTEVGKAFPSTVDLMANRIGVHADFTDNGNKPLIALNRLANWEKHNLLIFTMVSVGGVNLSSGNSTIRVGGMSRVGTHVRVIGNGSNVNNQGNASAQIVFGEHDFIKGEPIFPFMRNLSEATAKAVQAFEEAFAV